MSLWGIPEGGERKMDRCHTHVCLVSDQPIPNLLPILYDRTRPERVVLLVSPEMKRKQRDQWLKKAILAQGIRVDSEQIDPFDMAATRKTVEAVIGRRGPGGVVLNSTGGTKVMAFAAYEVFRNRGLPILYVDTTQHRLWELSSGECSPLPNLIDPVLYLRAYGYTATPRTPYPDEWKPAAQRLLAEVQAWGEALSRLNGPFAMAESTNGQEYLTRPAPIHEAGRQIVNLLEQHGIAELRTDESEERVWFPTETAKRFAAGGWLEVSLLDTIQHISGARDPMMSVEVVPASGTTNELDVIFTYRNQLHLIECKAKAFERDQPEKQDGPIYKVDSLRGVMGGTFGKAMLVSYRSLSEKMKQRCEDLRISPVDLTKGTDLVEAVTAWLDDVAQGGG